MNRLTNSHNRTLKSKSSLHQYLKTQYPYFKKIKRIQEITHNNIASTNLLIYSTQGRFILRHFTDDSKPEKIEKICKILKFCIKNNLKVLEPIKNKKQNYVDHHKKLYLTKYVEDSPYMGTNQELSDLAKNLALLHKTLKKSPITFNYNTKKSYYKIISLDELEKIELKIKNKNKDFIDRLLLQKILILKKTVSEFKTKSKDINFKKIKKQLIHYDIHPGNVIFRKKKVEAIIDFNQMRKDDQLIDVAFASFRFSIPFSKSNTQILNKIEFFVRNYNKFNQLTMEEKMNFNYFLKRTILARLSFILKSRYFHNSNTWTIDLEKYLMFLIMINKMENKLKAKIEKIGE